MPIHPTAPLPAAQHRILQAFIRAILPPRGNKRKTTRNELERVTDTLHRVLLRYFGFGVTPSQVLDAFQQLGYAVYTKQSEWHPDKKQWVPSASGATVRGGAPYEPNDAAFIYLDVEATTVQQLWLVTLALPANTGPEKLRQRDELHARIQALQQTLAAALEATGA
jgi:hypothetical protein